MWVSTQKTFKPNANSSLAVTKVSKFDPQVPVQTQEETYTIHNSLARYGAPVYTRTTLKALVELIEAALND